MEELERRTVPRVRDMMIEEITRLNNKRDRRLKKSQDEKAQKKEKPIRRQLVSLVYY